MIIQIGGNTRSYMKLLELEDYPFTINQLKLAFRQACFKYHPDTGGENASEEKFREVKKAFDHLENLCVDALPETKNKVNLDLNADIFDLTEPCKNCNGLGETMVYNTIKCPDCDSDIHFERLWERRFGERRGNGFHTIKCKWCEGGLFTLKSGRKVPCKACLGTGIFKKVKCRTCGGFGLVRIEKKDKCPDCKGEGVIHLNPMNPVIRRGAVLFG